MAEIFQNISKWLLRSPPSEWAINQLRELLIGALKQGPVPQHVAFEMDGNRRYARGKRMETIEGHHHGFEALARVLEICYKSGVKVVTVYAFSIENFNRPQYEVDGLMELAKVKLEQLTHHGDLLDKYGAAVRVLGQRDLLREDVLEVVDRAVEMTKNNKKNALNICLPYTSREEMATAIRSTVEDYMTPPEPKFTAFPASRITQKILSKQLDEKDQKDWPAVHEITPIPSSPTPSSRSVADDDTASSATLPPGSPSPPHITHHEPGQSLLKNPETITAETLNNHMYTAGDPPLDIFVRTSGVERLSDFMLWQAHQDTQIFFLKCLWPEFDLQHWLPVLLEWQWRQKQMDREERPEKKRARKAVKTA
ncbi:cis-prenyltransferase [Verticillium nonalfalfae]|uniref:Alkyl transferase n=2 Tax=Verticillium TaxID=1036719 RepID=C9SKL0_VERA1|nr:dehydrodolichyl diphosphate synthase [Verticillium alfalfae VaMs.102]XP_028497665.1 cis-prenyltransferase [Verticillium nonalfalfae]EEY19228.1 dehydrodolichyl diphosphate synthase [Verticillium alfalfae VaMs.102]RNJ59507.1 cis-prenyltransferase [Verticillium nonalfalfae]